eukprot:TRINITY_DN14514_c2_g5_i1.p1 TRINITY_DN14514_c2_g5~~TRINITY_DN14514_c2_g5_i1.p1  ORF type:complete len:460 (+),score=58.09 TRINITY_DN14514_c2_g5_i1:66-1445(+)
MSVVNNLEAQLLRAIADDNADEACRLLLPQDEQTSEAEPTSCATTPVSILLQRQVKATYNNRTDDLAIFNSVASFGLTFKLGDSLLDLSTRNESTNVAGVLRNAMGPLNIVPAESRIAAEDALLTALAADDDRALTSFLRSKGVPLSILSSLQVKATFGDKLDSSAFFHSVATYGLKYELGDTACELAARNGRDKVATALTQGSMASMSCQEASQSRELRVVLSNAASGDAVAEIAADTSWTIGMLRDAMPTPGCFRFISDGAPLSPGIHLADLCCDDAEVLHLGCTLVSTVTGECHAVFHHPGYARRRHRGRIAVHLSGDGTLDVLLVTTRDGPLPCANRPPAREDFTATFKGTWSAEAPGIVATISNGQTTESRFRHGRETYPLDFTCDLKMMVVQDDQLEIIESTKAKCFSVPDAFFAVGTVLTRVEPGAADEGPQSIVDQEWFRSLAEWREARAH